LEFPGELLDAKELAGIVCKTVAFAKEVKIYLFTK
jgi:hypothetical protein